MTAADFTQWLADMREAGRALSDAKCAKAIGMTPNSVVLMKRRGTDYRTALACAAALAGLPPYGRNDE